MGCDIHLFSEAKRNGKWEPAVPFVLSDWWFDTIQDEEDHEYDTPEYRARQKEFESMSEEEVFEKYGDDSRIIWEYPLDRALGQRNYNFFAILADVRNGRGFAGIDTGNGFNPISEPRGLPEDVSIEVKRQFEHYGVDGHSHSYITLKELLEYNWDQTTIHRGVIDEKEYTRMIKANNNSPIYWAGMTYGPSVEHISLADMKDLVDGKFQRDSSKDYVTKFEWTETYRELVGEDYLEELCTELSHYGDPEDVRIVFFFDN